MRWTRFIAAGVISATMAVEAQACMSAAPSMPQKWLFDAAMAVIKAELVQVRSGPRLPKNRARPIGGLDCSRTVILTLRVADTLKGPIYDEWEVLWRCGSRIAYERGELYFAAISRIGKDLRGDPTYDFFGELPSSAGCYWHHDVLFKATPDLEEKVAAWVLP